MKKKTTFPLEGITILDLTRMLPGPYCTMILGDLGAKVIRVEDPSYPYSNPLPYYPNTNVGAFNYILMRNKYSIGLNFKKEEAINVFYKLVEHADVVIEAFRPGVAKKLKIDYETLSKINKNLIYCSLTGYGQTGPYSRIPGHDLNYQAISGFLDLNSTRISGDGRSFGEKSENEYISTPVVPGIQSADIGGALYSAIAILSALVGRKAHGNHKSNELQSNNSVYIDISMLESAFSMNPMAAAYSFTNNPKESDILQGEFPFYSIYKTKDNRFLAMGLIETKFWNEFCKAIDSPHLIPKQFAQGDEKQKVFDEIQTKIGKKTAEEWISIFSNYDTCVSLVKTFQEACNDEQIQARQILHESHDNSKNDKNSKEKKPKFQNIKSPIIYNNFRLPIRRNAPKTGADYKEILIETGYTEEEIKQLKKKGIFR